MFPSTPSQETSGLEGKQNQLVPAGSDAKCILYPGNYKIVVHKTIQKQMIQKESVQGWWITWYTIKT